MSVILMVEDFEPLRASTADLLRLMGHCVLEAGDAESALDLLSRENIDVLFTDVSLPGTSGDVLAAEACSLRPGLKVVFGTALAGFARAAESEGPPTLRKPYSHAQLSAMFGAEPPCR